MLYPKPILNEAFSRQPSLKKDVWLALKNISDEALISGGSGVWRWFAQIRTEGIRKCAC